MEATNGQEALACLKKSKPVQLVLVDWVMPVMDGCEFLTRVRSDPSLRDVALVMVTEKGDVDHVLRALKAGADEYVIKPFDQQIISEKLKIVGFLPS
jgi:two-component system chemotaxis response regulator CheY